MPKPTWDTNKALDTLATAMMFCDDDQAFDTLIHAWRHLLRSALTVEEVARFLLHE